MNVAGLIKAALCNMNEKNDADTVNFYRDELLTYINDGYLQAVITRIKPVKMTICTSENGRVSINDVGDDFYQISRILDKDGIEVRYSLNSEYLFIKDGKYQVEYVFMPKELKDDEDEPIIGRAFHYILSDYATYRMFLKGSKARQARGDAFFSSYLNGISKLIEAKRVYIKNKFGCDANG